MNKKEEGKKKKHFRCQIASELERAVASFTSGPSYTASPPTLGSHNAHLESKCMKNFTQALLARTNTDCHWLVDKDQRVA